MKEYLKIKRKQQGDPLQVCEYTNEDGSILPVLKFQELSSLDFIEHCFSMRQGGVSEGYHASLNLTYSRGDDPQNVRKNYERLTKVFHGTPEQLFMTRFEHGTTVVRVDKAGQDPGDLRYDGMITNVPGIILGALVADCMPVMFADPVRKAIGLCHSGWRGTLGRISRETVERMHWEYGCDPGDIICAIGPSVCGECYEINDAIAEQFQQAYPGHGEEILVDKHNGHQMLDLWKSCAVSLYECGVKKVLITDICTVENTEILFSHRIMGGKRGNTGAFIQIKEGIW